MNISKLKIANSYVVTPKQFKDQRGLFLEWYNINSLSNVLGHGLKLAQANISVSTRGSLRGIHFAHLPPSQAKYVTVAHGSIIDFIIDLRINSSSFGKWDCVELNDANRKCVYIAEGLGHCFLALSDKAVVCYMVSEVYNPNSEHSINPLDQQIALNLPIPNEDLIISEKDKNAPTLVQAENLGLLPDISDCRNFYKNLTQ